MFFDKLMKIVKQFIGFGLVGFLNTIISWGIQWIFLYLGFHYQVGPVIAFIVTVLISYLLNNRFVFTVVGEDGKKKASRFEMKGLIKAYLSYSITGLFLNAALLFFWNDVIRIGDLMQPVLANIDWISPSFAEKAGEYTAPVLNMFITVPLNFVMNKLWVYGKKGTKTDTE